LTTGSLSQPDSQAKYSDKDINDMRLKLTRETEAGKILEICRAKMTVDTFEEIVGDLTTLMIRGHDILTKSSAVLFVQDIVLENKTDLIQPKTARKLATKFIEVYSQNSVQTSLQMRLPLVQLYASCLGLLFQIIAEFP